LMIRSKVGCFSVLSFFSGFLFLGLHPVESRFFLLYPFFLLVVCVESHLNVSLFSNARFISDEVRRLLMVGYTHVPFSF